MAVVLAATGFFLHLRLASELDHTLAASLRSRTQDIGALVQQSDTGLKDAAHGRGIATGANFAQILDGSGHVFDGTAGLQRRPLLSAVQLQQARRGARTFDLSAGGPETRALRLLAGPGPTPRPKVS